MQRTQDMIAVVLAISGFTVALIAGTATSNAPVSVVFRAIIAMLCCWVVGQILGKVTRILIDEHVAMYNATIPVPELAEVNKPVSSGAEAGVDKS